MSPDAIADDALLTVSAWQRGAARTYAPKLLTPQQHADHLLQCWQQRRHFKPIYRLVECQESCCPPLAPVNDNTSEQAFDANLGLVRETMGERV